MYKKESIIIQTSLNIIFPMIVGLLIYVFLRPPNIIFVQYIGFIDKLSFISEIKMYLSKMSIPNWFIYSLPGAIWVYSLTYFMGMLWIPQKTKWKYLWISIAPILAITYEIGQKIHVILGTFDLLDMFFILFGYVLALLSLKIKGVIYIEK